MELNKNDPEGVMRELDEAFTVAKITESHGNSQEWAVRAAKVNRFCREITNTEPSWVYISFDIFKIWQCYRRLLDLYSGEKRIFSGIRIKSELRVLEEHRLSFIDNLAVWRKNRE